MAHTQDKTVLPEAGQALPGRDSPMAVADRHVVLGSPLQPVLRPGLESIVLGLGCFWGAERRFWQLPGVVSTAVGYAGGQTPNPTYEEVCSGLTGHAEVVLVVFDPAAIDLEAILACFWEGHDPTQGMRQGNDRGTQYRSAIYATTEHQLQVAMQSRARYQEGLTGAAGGAITTEIKPLGAFYYGEDYHQQYLAKNPGGYCGLGGTGVPYPLGPRSG